MLEGQEDQEERWWMTVRINYQNESIFKSKLVGPNQFIMHLPKLKAIETFDLDLNLTHNTYYFSSEIQAIERLTLPHGLFLAAGGKSGDIELQNSQTKQIYLLKKPEVMHSSRSLINDMLDLGNGRLINCYNQGCIAIWDLAQPLSNDLQPISYKKVHDSFAYKIRRMDDESVLTCSNDQTVKLYDLQTTSVAQTFHHDSPIWCSYPLNHNIFASAGLMNRLLLWDTRSHKIIQKCELQHQETSFITRLDPNSLIFGDSYLMATCDLRKPIKQGFGDRRMRVSAETILVTEKGVVVGGRGGDVCLFRKGVEQPKFELRNIGEAFVPNFMSRIMQLPFLRQLQNALPNFGMDFELVDDNELEQDMEVIERMAPMQGQFQMEEEEEEIIQGERFQDEGIEEEPRDYLFEAGDGDDDEDWEDDDEEQEQDLHSEEQQNMPVDRAEHLNQERLVGEIQSGLIEPAVELPLNVQLGQVIIQQGLQQCQIKVQMLQPQPKQLNAISPEQHPPEEPIPEE